MIPLVSAEQMRALDTETITQIGVPGGVLMESAGRGIVEALWQLHHRGAIDLYGGQVLVVAGPGNNGGDGFVVARYLHNRGAAVRLLLCAERERIKGDALRHLEAAEACGVAPTVYSGDSGAAQVAALLQRLARRDVIIDALLGIGLTRAVSGPLRHVIEAVNHSTAVKVAVDLPSGLDADIGVPVGTVGEPAIVRADHTITLGLCKLGLISAPGFIYAGRVQLVDIGIPEALCARHGVSARLLDERCVLRLGQPLPPLGHKGSHGHLLLLAGSRGKSGAAQLGVRAALRTGVGLCTLAAPTELVDRVLGEQAACAMTYPYELDGGRAALAQQLLAASVGKHAIAVGPGLPTGDDMKHALLEVLGNGTAPLLLDADALNQLCGEDEALRAAAKGGRKLVLTPHPGEAARLLGESVAQVQADRVRSARELCRRTGAVVVLKGARTLIAAPDEAVPSAGEPSRDAEVANHAPPPSRQGPLSVCPTGNAGMGSGGMGDVLTGMLGALLAAGWPAYDAACAAVYWHGLAGDVLASERAPGSILLASDLIDAVDRARTRALAAVGPPSGWPITSLGAASIK